MVAPTTNISNTLDDSSPLNSTASNLSGLLVKPTQYQL